MTSAAQVVDLTCCTAVWTFRRGPRGDRWEHVAPDIDGADPRLPEVDDVGTDAYVDALFDLPGQETLSQVLVGERLLPEATMTLGRSQRLRWPLRCPTCRLTVPVLDDRLQLVLGRVAALGVSALPLHALARSVP